MMGIRSKVQENINKDKPVIFFDMDGVLANFKKGLVDYDVVSQDIDIGGHPVDKIDWDKFKGSTIEDNVYFKLEPFEDTLNFVKELRDKGYEVRVLTGLPRDKDPAKDKDGNDMYRTDRYGKQVPVYRPCSASSHAKRAWLDKHGLEDVKMTGCFAYQKPQFMVDNSILIDDKESNCKAWNTAAEKKGFNSVAILHENINLTKEKVYELIEPKQINKQTPSHEEIDQEI